MTQDNGYDLEQRSARPEAPDVALPWDGIAPGEVTLTAFEEAVNGSDPELPAMAHDAEFFTAVPVSTLSPFLQRQRRRSAPFEPRGLPLLRDIKPAAALDAMAAKGSPIWTIPLMCAGLALIACCMIIPQADANRRLAWEREMLRIDLQEVQHRVERNDAFLASLNDGPGLVERLAQRQLRVVPEGTMAIQIDDDWRFQERSPFALIQTDAQPAELPVYTPAGNKFAALCRDPKMQLYMLAAALFMLATGLVLGGTSPRNKPTPA